MRLEDFDFELPEGSIARYPTAERDGARLLVIDPARDTLLHRRFVELPELLDPGDLLVVNDSKVFPARLAARKVGSGGKVELLLVAPLGAGRWRAMVNASKPVRAGAALELLAEPGRVLTVEAEEGAGFVQVLLPEDALPLAARTGEIPLPPYLGRPAEESDRERYQTLFARAEGSVAAPTAGLHFSPRVLAALEARGVERVSLTLHVGPGTFLPVRAERIEEHRVLPERFALSAEAAARIRAAKREGRRVVAVGTTVTRVLETLGPAPEQAAGDTDLFIRPGHRFRVVDALLTNFHLPRSSLLMLVAALAGRERVLAAYRQAVAAGYRFYSYGDASFIPSIAREGA